MLLAKKRQKLELSLIADDAVIKYHGMHALLLLAWKQATWEVDLYYWFAIRST